MHCARGGLARCSGLATRARRVSKRVGYSLWSARPCRGGPTRPGSFPDMGGPMTRFRTISSLTVAGMVLAAVASTAFTLSSPQAATDGITPPPLPPGLAPVPAGNELFLGTHAVGTQNYVCQPSGAGFAYVLFTPQATLFGEDGVQIITHFNSPNPDEPNTDPKVVAPEGTI